MKRVLSLSELVDGYDAFLVDQFGVLLDGAGVYDYAPGALDQLRARGKAVLLVSNSGKRSAANAERLARHGISRATYFDMLTSGEVAHAELGRRIGVSLPGAARVWVETSDDEAVPLGGLDLQEVERAEEADLILIAGARPGARTLDDCEALLAPAAARRVPAICSNPDMTMLTPWGPDYGAGRIAERYERLGGVVEWIGKPYPAIYEEALRRLGNIDRRRILAIGDSPAHDLLGGARAGLATALVRTGIHAAESEGEVLARCERVGVAPDYLMPRFAF